MYNSSKSGHKKMLMVITIIEAADKYPCPHS